MPNNNPGLIPACAGKTPVAEVITAAGGGSSPRVRGKRRCLIFVASFSGLIPACAGKTWNNPPEPSKQSAHPRVCGEN